MPKPPGTTDRLSLYYGPYTIPPGWDANRVDLELPTQDGFLISLEPAMRRVQDLSEPMHTEAHIHHAHWFGFDPGNEEDNYFARPGTGTHEWVFGNGDEETRADFRRRSAAQPKGPVYGNFLPAGRNQTVIYMLHNKTSQPMAVYIVLDVIFKHGTRAQLEEIHKRPYHDVVGMLMGRTFDVPARGRRRRQVGVRQGQEVLRGKDKRHEGCAIEWVAPRDGTIVGTGGHLHPGGTQVTIENYGSTAEPVHARPPAPRLRRHAALEVRRDQPQRAASPRTTRPRSPTRRGARRCARATASGSPATTRTRTTPGTRR